MSGALEKNQRLTLSCARLGSELEGVCSHEGMAVFVPGVLPGETAEVQIVKALPNYAFGRLVQVLEPSAQRAQPRCPVYDKCGGCTACGGKEVLDRDALRDVYHVDAEVVAVQKQSIVLVDEKDATRS